MTDEGSLEDIFDINKFDSYKEDNRREVKKANDGLPNSIWETYSAFANCYGGVIILGVAENKDGSWRTTGLKAAEKEKLLKSFWDTINNTGKVSVNLLTDSNVEVYTVVEDIIIVIHVPMAKRDQKPVFINNNFLSGTFRRNYEGDYRCTVVKVKSMLRDQVEISTDMQVLDFAKMDDLNKETIEGYRNRHKNWEHDHPFDRLNDNDFLQSIGAAAISQIDDKLHPTAAGMLMFGNEYMITRYFPEFFLDYQEQLDPTIRWTDRIISTSGRWSGNVCDFYFMVYNKIQRVLKVPFKIVDGIRIDETPVHKAVREAIANCLIHADYMVSGGIVIKHFPEKIVLSNPGYIRTGKYQMRQGGKSDPRNKTLMKMFNLIHVGERSGSGVPKIINAWTDNGWKEPIIEEEYMPDKTVLTLEFVEKRGVKTGRKNKQEEQAGKNKEQKQGATDNIEEKKKAIRLFLEDGKVASAIEIADSLGVVPSYVRRIIQKMQDVESVGKARSTKYKIKD